MSEDTPKCAKLHHIKNSFRRNTCHLTPYQCVPRPGDLKLPQK